MIRNLTIAVLLFLWNSCIADQDKSGHQVIDIDALPLIELYPEKIIGGEEDSLFLFYKIGRMDVDEEGKLYVCDGNHRIVVLDTSGNLLNSFGREGEGPNEFKTPFSLKVSRNRIYVAEFHNQRIQMFDRYFRYFSTFSVNLGPFSEIAVDPNDRYIYIPNTGYDLKQKSILVFNGEKPFKFIRSFLDLRLPQKGENFSVMTLNGLVVDCDSEGYLYVIRKPFPFLYIYNAKWNKVSTIEFTGELVNLLKKPIKGGKSNSKTNMIKIFCEDIFLNSNNDIFMLLSRKHILYYNRTQKKWYSLLAHPMKNPAKKRITWYQSVTSIGQKLFVADQGIEGIICFQLMF